MSDLEATGARVHTATPISAAAVGKLRSLGGSGVMFSQTDGLVDAFAEVFARMAASSAAPVENVEPASETDNLQDNADTGPVESDQDVSQQSDQSNGDSESQSRVEKVVTEVAEETEVVIDTGPLEQEIDTDDQSATAAEVEIEDDHRFEEVTVAAVETRQAEVVEEQVETTDFVVQEVVQHDEGDNRRRQQRETELVKPVDSLEDGRWRSERTTEEASDQNVAGGEDFDLEEELTAKPTTDGESAGSKRRQRGRARYTENSEEIPLQNVSQTNQARSRQRTDVVQQVQNTGESFQNQVEAAADAPRSASRGAPTNVVNVQNVAASVHRSAASAATQSGTPSGAQSGPRAPNQAIEPNQHAGRDAAKPPPKAKQAGNNTAETISRVKLIQRVSKAFQHLGPEGGVIRLRLAPAEMGSVRVEMRIQQRKVQARVVAETEAASTALREHLPELRQRLESQGMQVERIEIEAEGNESDWSHQRHSSGQHDGGQLNDRRGGPFWEQEIERQRPPAAVSPAVSQPAGPAIVPEAAATLGGVDIRF